MLRNKIIPVIFVTLLCLLQNNVANAKEDKNENYQEDCWIDDIKKHFFTTDSEIEKLWIQRNLQKDEIKVIKENLNNIRDEIKSIQSNKKEIAKDYKTSFGRKKDLESIKELNEKLNIVFSKYDTLLNKLENMESSKAKNDVNLDNNIPSNNLLISDNPTHYLDNKNLSLSIIFIFAVIVLVIAVIIQIFIKISKIQNSFVAQLNCKAKLNEEKLISFLQSNAVDMKNAIDSFLKYKEKTIHNEEPDHTLVKALADRIAFMQMTLFKMDNSVRGFRQLNKAVHQMIDSLLVNGYEIVDMIGLPYNDGMKVIANFIEDETLKEGEQVITGITKPQINYKGAMIQVAQITVSQNI